MNQTELEHLSGIDRHRFEKAHNKKASELTLDDCMVIARCGEIFKEDPDLDLWIYGGEQFDLQIWGEYPDDADEIDDNGNVIPPETVNLAVFNVDSEGETNYDEPIHQWTVDYNQTEEWR